VVDAELTNCTREQLVGDCRRAADMEIDHVIPATLRRDGNLDYLPPTRVAAD
jgi:hypothetical protein